MQLWAAPRLYAVGWCRALLFGMALRETAVILSARAERDALAGRHALFGVPRALRLRC